MCGCAGVSVAGSMDVRQMEMVRFVGPSYGGQVYRVGLRDYIFGQNRSHKTQLMYADDIVALLAEHPCDFIVIPADLRAQAARLELEKPIVALSDIDAGLKQALLDGGLVTVGQVIACGATILGSEEVPNELRARFGLPPVELIEDDS